nr:MAG TPA: hypothetical protein [Bacteriophage sp.]
MADIDHFRTYKYYINSKCQDIYYYTYILAVTA